MKRYATLLSAVFAMLVNPVTTALGEPRITEGRLDATGPDGRDLGPCPLEHTAVEAELSGSLAQVSVTQRFHNPFRDKIEAVYVFPLHQDSAVDEMTMTVGDRVVKGLIKEREEAKRVYEDAKARGKVASLLDQERPNIFSQAVANIEPGQQVTITIRYSQTMEWKDGRYEFDFPTVVGPRYIPGNPKSSPDGEPMPQATRDGKPAPGPNGEAPVVNPDPAPPTDQVPDANRITPPVAELGYRAGHDLSITVRINAGLPISDLKSALHEITVEHPNGDLTRAVVSLKDKAEIPNRDFAISFRTTGDGITDAALTHTDDLGKFFMLVLQPPARVKPTEIVPRELVFVVDTSGSMGGFPIETSKALMKRAIEGLRPADRFNLITFAGGTSMLFDEPVGNSAENRSKALRFLDQLQGAGGTEMMKAIDAALGDGHDSNKVRVVCFLTDGYVGNDLAIVDAVKKHAGISRVFSFGIGTAVNRFLLDSMALAGRGEACYVLKHEDAKKAADEFYQRIDAPVLTDISLDFGGLAVEEVFPPRVEDLFSAKPVVVKGRYTKAGSGVIKLKGRTAAGSIEREIKVSLPEGNPDNRVLASQWARAKVGHLMMEDMNGAQGGNMKPELKQQITKLGLDYHLMTQFTSFVAVEERTSTEGGIPRTIQVPVEMPENVSHAGVFGEMSAMSKSAALGAGSGGVGFGGGFGSGTGLGTGKMFGLIPETMRKRCSKEDRLQRLKENGGTPACEDAVVKALDWLKQGQKPDGAWCESNSTSMTAYALLAYLGHCETPLSEKYGETVLKAMVYLVNRSTQNNGVLSDKPEDPQWPHVHAIATTALAESLVYTKSLKIEVPSLEDAVRKGAQSILDRQLANGAWEAPGGNPQDLSAQLRLTCENLQALKAASRLPLRFTGMSASVAKALRFIRSCDRSEGGRLDLAYDPELAGIVAFTFQQWGKGQDKLVVKTCDSIALRPAFRWDAAGADLQVLSNSAYAMIYQGGKPWADFNKTFLPEVLKSQEQDGSFKVIGGGKDAPRVGGPGLDLHYRTCLAALTLEVYYRYLYDELRRGSGI